MPSSPKWKWGKGVGMIKWSSRWIAELKDVDPLSVINIFKLAFKKSVIITLINKLIVIFIIRHFFFVSTDVLKKKRKEKTLYTTKFHWLSWWWNISKENRCIKWMRVSLIIVHRGGSSLSTFEVTFTCILGIIIWYMKNLCIVNLLKSLVIVTITTIKDSSFMF